MDDAIDRAKRGDLEFFKEAPLEILLNARDSKDNTVLSVAVKNNRLDCCELICKRCPSLLYHRNRPHGLTALHIVAYSGNLDILKLLISACDKADQEGDSACDKADQEGDSACDKADQEGDRAGKQKALTLRTTRKGNNAMHRAVHGRQLKSVELLIDADPNKELLRARNSFNNTPLHLAVGLKSDPDIARSLIKADPDFSYGANFEVKTPLLIAIDQAENMWPNDNREMLKLILELHPTQSMVEVNLNRWTALHYCVFKTELDTTEYIIQSCPESSNVPDNEGQNFFQLAVKVGNVKMVKHILGMKEITSTVFNRPDNLGRTPWEVVAARGNVEMVKDFYKACPSLIYHQSKDGRTALHYAAWKGEPKMLKFLIKAGAKSYNEYAEDHIESGGGDKMMLLTMVDEQGDTALHKAVLNHKLEAVKLLVEADPDYEYGANSDGKTPLLIAIDKANMWHKNDKEMVKLMMDTIEYIIKSCPKSSKLADNEGQNFFHHAVKSGNVEMVKQILGMKDISSTVLNRPDNLGRTPWDVAAVNQNESMVICLHEDPRVDKKLTATKNLHWVVEEQNFKMMNMFVKTNSDWLMNIELEVIQNSIDEEGDTLLLKAAQENHLFLCKELYKRHPSLIYHQSKDGRTALHHAAWRGTTEMLKFLIAAGAKSENEYAEDDIESGGCKKLLTMVDDQGDAALHRAVLNHQLEAVKLLVVADPDYEYGANTSGYTPIMISVQEARSNENMFDSGKIRKFLFEMQPSQIMAHRFENNRTLLHQATSDGDLSTIEDIIKFCPNCLELVDNEGKNFLHIAAELGKVQVVRQVLSAIDVLHINVLNDEDNDGNTPLHIAAMNGNDPLTKCFLYDPRVIKTTVNKDGQHVLRAIKFSYDKGNAGVFDITATEDKIDLKEVMDAMDHAKRGDLEFFKEAPLDILLNARDSNNETVLSIVVINNLMNARDSYDDDTLSMVVNDNHRDCCEVICKRCPSLLYEKSNRGCTALHHAAWKGEPKMLKFLIEAGAKSYNEHAEDEIESGGDESFPQNMLVTVEDENGDTALHRAVLNHKLEAVKLLVEADLDYEYHANTTDETPIMISVREARSNGNMFDSGKIRELLFKMQPSQTMVCTGEHDWTLLHQATFNGDLRTIKDIIKFCPRCLDVVDNKGKNFLHIAAKFEKVQVVRQVLKAKVIPFNVLNDQDNDGNTPLHIAAITGNEPLTKYFLFDPRVIKTTMNKNGQHVLRAINFSYDKRKAGVFDITATEVKIDLKEVMDAMDHAKRGDLEFFKEAPLDILLNAKDSNGETVLPIVVNNIHLDCCKVIYKRCPSLIYHQTRRGTPLHIAARSGNLDILKLFISACDKAYLENQHDIEDQGVDRAQLQNNDLLRAVDNKGQNFFHRAVKSGSVQMVKHILGMEEVNPTVLNSLDNLGRTPLDVAAISQNESMILCLHEDPRMNKKLTVTKNLNWVVEKHNFVMMNLFLKANVDLLMNIELEVFQKSIDEEGDTILFKAAQENHLFLCKELYKRCPSLIYHQSKGGRTALHQAAWKGEPKMLKFLIAAGAKSDNEFAEDNIEIGGGKKLLMMVDDQGDTALHRAVLNHKLEAVKLLVEADPDCEYDANTFGETPIMISVREARSKKNKFDSGKIRKLLFEMHPSQTMAKRGENGWTLLHDATSEGDLSCIEDIIKFCPGYLDVEDNKGKNFLHIAAELEKVEVVRQVLRAKDIPPNVFHDQDKAGNTPLDIAAKSKNKLLTRCFLFDLNVIKTMPHREENGWTLLHQAASDGDIGIIKDIIKWPSYLDVLDSEDKNFLHIAAEFEKVEVVKLILRAEDIPDCVLNHKDKYGNTPFHIAALTGNEPLTRCFLFDKNVKKTTENKKGEKALHAIKFPYDKRKAGVFDKVDTVDQSELKDQSDFDLVVGALIATVSFAAGITVPGGYISDGPNQGTAVFSKRVSFASFTISNTFALVFSLFAVFSHFCARRLSWDADIICLLYVAKFCTLAAMYCMMAAFIAGSFAILAKANWLAIVVCIISCLFFIFGCGPLWMWKFGKQSKRPASQRIRIWFKKCFGLANVGNALVEEGGNALVEEGGNALVSPKAF